MENIHNNKSQTQIAEDLVVLATKCLPLNQLVAIQPKSVLIGENAIFDSFSMLEFLIEVERFFNVEILNKEAGVSALKSIETLSAYVEDLIKSK